MYSMSFEIIKDNYLNSLWIPKHSTCILGQKKVYCIRLCRPRDTGWPRVPAYAEWVVLAWSWFNCRHWMCQWSFLLCFQFALDWFVMIYPYPPFTKEGLPVSDSFAVFDGSPWWTFKLSLISHRWVAIKLKPGI